MNDELYQKAKAVPIREVLEHYNISIHGDKINCLVHDEKTPSAQIYDKGEGDNSISCFGCHENYDGIAVVMKMEQCDFVNALNYLTSNFTAGIYVAKKKKDLTFYFDMNRELRQLIADGGDIKIIKRYAQMIDMFNTNTKVMLQLYGVMVNKLGIGGKK